ncbi:MAG TPA: hypothetical protein VGC58_02900 [Candidatus Paceibacterota bacterium]
MDADAVLVLTLKILSIYLIVSGLFIIFKGKSIPHLLKDFYDHPAVVYLSGIILIFLASMYLIQYNIWDGTWRTIVTVFVWLVGLKGIVYVFAPKSINEMAIKKSRKFFGVYGVIAVVVGLYLFFLK